MTISQLSSQITQNPSTQNNSCYHELQQESPAFLQAQQYDPQGVKFEKLELQPTNNNALPLFNNQQLLINSECSQVSYNSESSFSGYDQCPQVSYNSESSFSGYNPESCLSGYEDRCPPVSFNSEFFSSVNNDEWNFFATLLNEVDSRSNVVSKKSLSQGVVIREGEPIPKKKGCQWTKDEHKLFLLGLKKHGKGDWKSISRNFVRTRSSIQVASHAQKYFNRTGSTKKRKRISIHDIKDVDNKSIDDLVKKGLLSPDKASVVLKPDHRLQTPVVEQHNAEGIPEDRLIDEIAPVVEQLNPQGLLNNFSLHGQIDEITPIVKQQKGIANDLSLHSQIDENAPYIGHSHDFTIPEDWVQGLFLPMQ
ncbi:hypothetical protein vseg_011263 [Gypsophila vaccaria]